jgi:hypothetical protein
MMGANKQTGRPVPHIPVSWGELIDKMTILEIKAERIEAESARANSLKELGLIRAFAEDALASDETLAEQKRALKDVNETLWDIEDRIRDKEREGKFDAEFIALARSVYKSNDERARIKKTINLHLVSEIVEEKSYKEY